MADDGPQETTETQAEQDTRLDRLEATQAEQGGKLDQIIAMIKGDGKEEAVPAQTGDGPDPSTIADQVKQAVRDVHAERDQAAAKAKPEAAPEHAPREQQSGFRGKLQRAMYGGDPT